MTGRPTFSSRHGALGSGGSGEPDGHHFNGQHFGVRTSHFPWYLQHFGAQSFHVGWYFATRVHLGFVLVFISDWFRVCFAFLGLVLGLVWGLFRGGLGST